MKRAPDAACLYCQHPEDTAEHTIFDCAHWDPLRLPVKMLLHVQKSKVNKKKQQFWPTLPKSPHLVKTLCFVLISANIPLNKVSNQSFRKFLEVYTVNNVSTETNLRLGYIDDILDETMSKIKLELSGKKVWVNIDETTDIEGRFIGILEADYK
ncbi:hypothetical protein QTP88_014588 [Uroleucon formosanum]